MRTKQLKENTIIAFSGFLLVIIAIGLGGTSDYDEQVILNMSQSTYNEISSDLSTQTGSTPSDHEIVIEYKNRQNHN